ncbi:MAG: signal peptide peptidase SppA [Acidobacteria bacterium]|nr:signal peptide peptidase SppA [Acidobacteriota bacterium]
MQKRTLSWILIAALVLFAIFIVSLFSFMALVSDDEPVSGFTAGGSRIAMIPIEGVIDDRMAKNVNRYLKQYGDDSRIKAVILRVDSPGGGVAPSQEIYTEVRRLRDEKKKKVIVSMGSVAASGGYYLSCPADVIYANPGSVTGSIGVIAEWINYKDLAEWAKVKPVVFKSGEFKDTGSPTRDLTDREKAYFQSMIDELNGQFIRAVLEGRKGRGEQGNEIDEKKLLTLADGRVYTGNTALRNGLIDAIGNYEDALRRTAELVGVKGKPTVITPPKEREPFPLFDLLLGVSRIGSFSPSSIPQSLSEIDTSIKFKYQWR